MSDEREKDAHSGVDTTGHEWDGIKELDNPLPRWWLWVFWATIAFSVVYWILMPAWPGLTGYTKGLRNHSDRAAVATALKALADQRRQGSERLTRATLEQIEADPALQAWALSAGASVFGDNCATCHGTGGAGAKGYPNLRDDVWLWGGKPEEIERTIRAGVRSGHPDAHVSQMPAFGRDGLLQPAQVNDLTEYVWALSGHRADPAAVGRARTLFADQCAACHGAEGRGGVGAFGAPDLTDREWLYRDRDQKEAIHDQIWYGRNGVMPAWEQRFDAATLKALAVYIHANSGGK